jgi:hypothetical protein
MSRLDSRCARIGIFDDGRAQPQAFFLPTTKNSDLGLTKSAKHRDNGARDLHRMKFTPRLRNSPIIAKGEAEMVAYLRRFLAPRVVPSLPESPAQAEARARRNRENDEVKQTVELISQTARAFRWNTSPETFWGKLGNMQAALLFININRLPPQLAKLRASAPSDLADAWDQEKKERTQRDAHFLSMSCRFFVNHE